MQTLQPADRWANVGVVMEVEGGVGPNMCTAPVALDRVLESSVSLRPRMGADTWITHFMWRRCDEFCYFCQSWDLLQCTALGTTAVPFLSKSANTSEDRQDVQRGLSLSCRARAYIGEMEIPLVHATAY